MQTVEREWGIPFGGGRALLAVGSSIRLEWS